MTDTSDESVLAKGVDLLNLCDVLQHAGWDAVASEMLGEVAARLDHAPAGGLWTLAIDRAGRFKVTDTRVDGESVEIRRLRSGHVVTLTVEDRHISTVTGRLGSEADVQPILREFGRLVCGHEATTGAEIAGEDSA